MKIKSLLARPFASIVYSKVRKSMLTAVADQQAMLLSLIKDASRTKFSQDHNLSAVRSHEDYVKAVPIRDYEGFRAYIDEIKNGGTHI